jgi:signal transduction histidine kinase
LDRTEWLPEVQADPVQLKEAIVNLLVNASESIEESGRIVIREERTNASPQGAALTIHISDDGPGIPDEIQQQIFHPFFSTKSEGTGLGLSITKRIVEEHGGSIAFESSPAQGTSFAITLPVKEE